MLSNQKLEVLEKQLDYLHTALKQEGKFLSKGGIHLLNREFREVNAKIAEAQKRNYVGATESGKKVYIADSQWQSVCSKCMYIEDTPSGWDADDLDMVSGESQTFVCDGGQDWTEVVIWN